MLHLRAWRERAAYKSQQALANAAGLPQSTVSHLENGIIISPRLQTAQRLVAGLNAQLPEPITSDDLLHAPPPPVEAASV